MEPIRAIRRSINYLKTWLLRRKKCNNDTAEQNAGDENFKPKSLIRRHLLEERRMEKVKPWVCEPSRSSYSAYFSFAYHMIKLFTPTARKATFSQEFKTLSHKRTGECG
jgi:hypothetical protein